MTTNAEKALRNWALALLATALFGCASTQIKVEGSHPRSETIAAADAYIQANMEEIKRKTNAIDKNMQWARAGTFIGALGLGASGLAGLHRDAAVGFATLGAVSFQGLPLFGPQAWLPMCREATEALECLSDISRPLEGKFGSLRLALQQGESLKLKYSKEHADADGPYRKALEQVVPPGLAELERSLYKGRRSMRAEKTIAQALFDNARMISRRLEYALGDSQASLAAFKEAASGIVSQATAASTAAKAAATSQSGSATTTTPKAQNLFLSDDLGAEEARANSLLATVLDARDAIEASIRAVGESSLDEATLNTCKAKVTGAVVPLTLDPTQSEIVLGMTGGEKFVDASGGNGFIIGVWTSTKPPSDLIAESSSVQPGGTRFVFKQLKKETTKEQVFTFRISDTTNSPQKKTITIKVPVEK